MLILVLNRFYVMDEIVFAEQKRSEIVHEVRHRLCLMVKHKTVEHYAIYFFFFINSV